MISFPKNLSDAIFKHVIKPGKQQAIRLRENYQHHKNHENLHDIYLMSRMPATYAAVLNVLEKISPDEVIKTVLDIGSGPGTGLWALQERFPYLESYTGFEQDNHFIELSKKLSNLIQGFHVHWIKGRYPDQLPDLCVDLVLMAYTLGENNLTVLEKTLEKIWRYNVSEWLVVIEPGTPKGFECILHARDYIIQNGGYIYAPCKGNYACPLLQNDWCHFSVRLERTLFQKHVKGATLPYEDEKFTYLIARKKTVMFPEHETRIIKSPLLRPGHITLDSCSKMGYHRHTFSKSKQNIYKKAKKINWGDSFIYEDNEN